MTINARQDGAQERLEPIPATRVSHGRPPSIGALYGRPRGCVEPKPIATPTHKAGRRELPVQRRSLPRFHECTGIVGQAAMVQHHAGHGLVGAVLGIRLDARKGFTNLLKSARGRVPSVFAAGLEGHLQCHHFARHDLDLLARHAADVFVLADKRAVAPQGQFSSLRSRVLCTALASVTERHNRSVALGSRIASRYRPFEDGTDVVGCGGHRSSPCFVVPNIGPLALSVKREKP